MLPITDEPMDDQELRSYRTLHLVASLLVSLMVGTF